MAEQLIVEDCIYERELLSINLDQARKNIGLSLLSYSDKLGFAQLGSYMKW